jgi:hypothetical protein
MVKVNPRAQAGLWSAGSMESNVTRVADDQNLHDVLSSVRRAGAQCGHGALAGRIH